MLVPNPNENVALIFRQGKDILVPPFEVPTRRRGEGESYERTIDLLAEEVGIDASISHAIAIPRQHEVVRFPMRLYLMHDYSTGITSPRSDFMVNIADLPEAIAEHAYFSDTERALFWAVIRRFEYDNL